jgi:hypothetical protein
LDTDNSIWIYHCDALKEELVFKRDIIQHENSGHEIISPSARYILIPIRKEKVKKLKRKKKNFIFQLDSSILY